MSLEIVQIIEDESLHARLLDRSLRRARYRTNVAGDGVTGLSDVKRLNPSLVLLDIMWPGMNDLEVCRRIRGAAGTRQIPIIMISALGGEEDRIAGYRDGCGRLPHQPVQCARGRNPCGLSTPENTSSFQ